jgi:Tfp pilus assembly protein PilF
MESAEWEGPGIVARDRLASLRVQQNDLAGADELIAEVLGKSPRDDDALFLRGKLAVARKDPKTAIADLRSVLRDRPKSVGAMRLLARAFMINGDVALGQEILERAVDADPTDGNARLDLAQLLVSSGRPEQAKPIIDVLVRQQPSNTDALQEQFKIAAANKDGAAARAAADALVAIQPKLATGYYDQGVAAEMDQRNSQAVQLYSAALDLQPDAHEPLQALTRELIHENRLPDALQRLDDVIARYPQDAFAPNLKGEILVSQQRAAEAAVAFKTAIDREPSNWLPYRNLALAQSAERDDSAAVATLHSGIVKAETPEPLEAALAGLYERSGKPEAAVQVYESGLRHSPNSELIANNLAMLLVNAKGDVASLERARQLSVRLAGSNNPNYLDTYGWVLYKQGEAPAAVSVLQKASSRAPEFPEIWFHLGMAQVRAGQSDAARASLGRALQSGDRFFGSDEARQTLDKLAKQTPGEVIPQS